MKPSISNIPGVPGNQDDPEYDNFLNVFQINIGTPEQLFTTKADPDKMWNLYLSSFPVTERQHYNCNTCRHFIQKYGGLVTIDGTTGALQPAVWNPLNVTDTYRKAVTKLWNYVMKQDTATGVFLSSEPVFGHAQTGVWKHMSFHNPKPWTGRKQTAEQRMAEVLHNAENIRTALSTWTDKTFSKAASFVEINGTLMRGEKILEPFNWLYALKNMVDVNGLTTTGWNQILCAVAGAPNAFCHPRSSMLGTLLDDIQNGLDFANIVRKFNDKMNPLQYQRPQTAPAAQTVARANKLFTDLGLEEALKRRHVSIVDVRHAAQSAMPGDLFWFPEEKQKLIRTVAAGPFSPRLAATPLMTPVSQDMGHVTWAKFERDILPHAADIAVEAGNESRNFYTLTKGPDHAPAILQWDGTLSKRNSFAWYTYAYGSLPAQYGLTMNPLFAWKVSAIVRKPNQWYGSPCKHYGEGVILLLKDARDSGNPGLCLFPEMLRSDLHEIRSVIEAHSKGARLAGTDGASGIGIMDGKNKPVRVRIRTRHNDSIVRIFTIDRWN